MDNSRVLEEDLIEPQGDNCEYGYQSDISKLKSGELYKFAIKNSDFDEHRGAEQQCDYEELWGVFNKIEEQRVVLETATVDFLRFSIHTTLSINELRFRLASRCDLRDYIYNLAWHEAKRQLAQKIE